MKPVRPLADVVRDFVEEGLFCTGLQASVRGPAGTADLVEGTSTGCRLGVHTLFNVVCATKPVLAMGLGALLDREAIPIDEPVASILKGPGVFEHVDFTVADLLRHEAGLAHPSLAEANLAAAAELPELIRTGLAARGRGYSEYLSQVVTKALIETLAETPAATYMADSILEPLGLSDDIVFGWRESSLSSKVERIGVFIRGLPHESLPMLHDRSPHVACADRIVLGGYASAYGLCEFYAQLGEVYRGGAVLGLPSSRTLLALLHSPGARIDDPALRRRCRLAGGFMVDLADHGYGARVSSLAFGHTGVMGASFGFYDPESDVAGAVVANALHSSPLDLDYFRDVLVGALVDAGLAGVHGG